MGINSTRQPQYLAFFLIMVLLVPLGAFSFSFFGEKAQYNTNSISTSNSSPDVDLSSLPQIDYETLNQSWYDQNIEMLIIVPNENYVDEVQPLADWKNQKGVKTIILSNYTDYNGTDGPEKIRNMIKSYYESDGIRWVLLAGDAQSDLLPIRYVWNPDLRDCGLSDTEPVNSGDMEKPTDYYYADLTGTWNSDGDEYYGEAAKYNDFGEDEIDWTPEVYVGRLPASNEGELSDMIQKTLKYEKNPNVGDWMNNMLLVGGISSYETSDGEDEAKLTTYILQNYAEDQINFTHLARNALYIPPDPWEELERHTFRNKFNLGYSTVLFAGHGTYYEYNDIAGDIYTRLEALACTNFNMPSLIYADACATATYDANDNNIGEELMQNSDRGAIGYVGAMRLSLYFNDDEDLEALNRGNAKLFWKVFFEDQTYQQGKTLYDSKVAYMNSHYYKYERNSNYEEAERKQLTTYNLLGDPEVDIYTNIPGIITENPFPSQIYEGEMLNITIRDNYNRPVENARVYLYNQEKGIARTVYGDKSGNVKFRLPLGAAITYNVSISGHNLLGLSNFSFTTLPDNDNPDIFDVDLLTPNPSTFTNLNFQINTSDNASGIESVYVLFSTDNFNNYFYYHVSNAFDEDESFFNLETNKLQPGNYKYLVYTRDFTNKSTLMYDSSFQINIEVPISFYVLVGSVIGIICVAVASSIIYVKSIRLYPTKLEKLQVEQQ
ncbi:MAG: hypothetical protein EU541_02460 [Promethearchaeota archaeon]|nr:MAG: hypothetical protein EU541_02460 [Candidatus Lokiarchaeota archaeon]